MAEPSKQIIDEAIARSRALADGGDDDGSIDVFRALVESHPGNAVVWAEYAYAFDRAGREEEAVAPYRRAMELGLPEDYLPGHLLGLGSTLRNIGQVDEAVSVLEDSVAQFPEHAALRVFLAFAQHSHSDNMGALVTLLELIQTSPGVDLNGFGRAVRYYTDELRNERP